MPPDGRHRERRLRFRQPFAALLALAAFAAGGCSSGTGGLATGGDVSNGKTLFQQQCASCHGLADAGSRSTVGPNLDDAFAGVRQQGFSEGSIRNIVSDQIKYAVEPMPQNLVTGSDADDVAAYVASVAGTQGFSEEATAETGEDGGGGSGGQPDGAALFASSGCGSCHTLEAANASGTVGPNLDESKPTLELAIDRITNGKGPMPPFKDQLSEAEIRALAQFVVDSVG